MTSFSTTRLGWPKRRRFQNTMEAMWNSRISKHTRLNCSMNQNMFISQHGLKRSKKHRERKDKHLRSIMIQEFLKLPLMFKKWRTFNNHGGKVLLSKRWITRNQFRILESDDKKSGKPRELLILRTSDKVFMWLNSIVRKNISSHFFEDHGSCSDFT